MAHDPLMPCPPVVVPDSLCATEAEIFRPVDPATVPEIADVLAYLTEHDPDVLAAVADVDRSIIWTALDGMTPFEYVRAGAQMIEDISNFAERAHLVPADNSAA